MYRYSALQSGFTMVELVVVMVLIGIISTVVGSFIAQPVEGFDALSRRTALVDEADTAIRRMFREVGSAVPNTLRISQADANTTALEILHIVDGGRYRAFASPGDALEFTANDSQFDTLGTLQQAGLVEMGANCTQGDDYVSATSYGDCVVVYNTGQTGANAYAGTGQLTSNVANLLALSVGTSADGSDQLTLSNTRLASGYPAFPFGSPQQRFFIVDTPVTFLCDLNAGTITRYEGYDIEVDQTNVDTQLELVAAGAELNTPEISLLATGVTACNFDYVAGTASRNGLLTIELVVSKRSEQMTLLSQAHVSNSP